MEHINLIILGVIALLFIIYYKKDIKEGLKNSSPKSSGSKSSNGSSGSGSSMKTAINDGAKLNGDGDRKSNSNSKPVNPDKFRCFSKDTMLQMEDGSFIRICDATIGQRILSYSLQNGLTYSPIVSIPHEKNDIYAEFVNILTETNKNVKMTKCHLIPVSKSNGPFELISANKININDTIMTIDGQERVVSKESCFDNGIYTVVTKDDYIITNNIIASPFAVFHMLPSMYYQIHKVIHSINPQILETDMFNRFNNANIQMVNSL